MPLMLPLLRSLSCTTLALLLPLLRSLSCTTLIVLLLGLLGAKVGGGEAGTAWPDKGEADGLLGRRLLI